MARMRQVITVAAIGENHDLRLNDNRINLPVERGGPRISFWEVVAGDGVGKETAQ